MIVFKLNSRFYVKVIVSIFLLAFFKVFASTHLDSRIKLLDSIKQDNQKQTKVRKEIFGFHPSWEGKSYKNYKFDLLSGVSYFSYKLDPKTGNYLSIGDWETTSLVNLAKENNCRVYLTISSTSSQSNSIFLNNSKARRRSIIKVLELLKLRKADGITINFEDVNYKESSLFVSYVKEFFEVLNKENKTIMITLPAINYSRYDVSKLSKYVTRFLVMGYNYNGGWSKKAAGVSPLSNLKTTMNYYLDKGISKNRLILVLPYYGSKWVIGKEEGLDEFCGYISYSKIKDLTMKYPVEYDKLSKVAFVNYKKDSLSYRIIFDDAKTLGEKYDYIINEGFEGVGIWALGYDDGYTSLWNELDNKFLKHEVSKKYIESKHQVEQSIWIIFIENKNLKYILFFILFFIVYVGFLTSLRHSQVRKVIFKGKLIRILMLILAPISISIFSWCFSEELIKLLNNFPFLGKVILIIVLFFGVIYGYAVYSTINNYGENERKNTP